jgi:peptidoglycan/LPS O-acetylase OafA/YrhL
MSASTIGPPASHRGQTLREAKRIPRFDGVRGICSVALLTVHIAWTGSLIGNYNQPPVNLPAATVINGFQIVMGVFFLLSGLFIFRSFARPVIAGGTPQPELGPYFLRRVLRLLPPYYLMVGAALLLLNFNSIHSTWYVLRPLLLLQNYNQVWMAGLDITWTVSTEFQAYLALPLLAWSVAWYARRGATPVIRARRMMIPVPILFVLGLVWVVYLHRPSMGIFPAQYWWPLGMIGVIAAGMMLGVMSGLSQVDPENTPSLFRLATKRPNIFWLIAMGVFALDCARIFDRPGYSDWDDEKGAIMFYLMFIAFCLLIVTPMIANAQSRLIQAVLGNRVVVYLGRISYGIYLWHFVVMNLYLRNGNLFHGGAPATVPALRGKVGFVELESAVLVGTIVIASLSYYLLERPILQLGDRWVAARRERRAAAADMTPSREVERI